MRNVFINANIVTPDRVIEDGCMSVENGVITEIGKKIETDHAKVTDVKGRYYWLFTLLSVVFLFCV